MKKISLNYIIKACFVIFTFTSLTACGSKNIEAVKNENKTTFNPPQNLKIKRTYRMLTDGVESGKMESVRAVDASKSELLIKDSAKSLISFHELNDTKSEETFWLSKNGLAEYEGKFMNLKSGEEFSNSFTLKGDTLHFESKSDDEPKPYTQKFKKGKDYHTATIYIDPTDRELKAGSEYDRRMLDVSFARTMKLKERFLRMDTFTLGEHTFDCHVIFIDYGHLHGEVWLAKDELGWFLIYEKATATEGSFELVLDGYQKVNVEQNLS